MHFARGKLIVAPDRLRMMMMDKVVVVLLFCGGDRGESKFKQNAASEVTGQLKPTLGNYDSV
jgi:hypothetical protein